MRARAVLFLAITAALVVVPAAAATATGSSDAAIEAALDDWLPSDGDWSQVDSSDTTGTRGRCESGRLIHWAEPGGGTGGLVWAHCANHDEAVALLNLTWASQGWFPAVGAPSAFGDGFELISPTLDRTNLNRIWTQGDWMLTVARSCDPADPTGCGAATAADARALAAIVGQPVDPVRPIPRLTDDYFSGWVPPDDNGWRLYAADRISGGDLERCIDGASNSWTGVDGSYVQVFWVRCATPAIAFAFQHERWANITNRDGLPEAFGDGYDLASRYFPPNGLEGISRSWVQGDIYVNVERTCPQGEDACSTTTVEYAHQLVRLLPGTVSKDTTLESAVGEAGWLFIAVPVATFLLLFLPQRIYFWWRSRGYPVADAPANFTPVDGLVRRVRTGRIVRRVILTILVAIAWWNAVAYVAGQAWDPTVQILFVFLSPFLFFALVGWVLRLVWKPHPLIGVGRRRGRPTPLGVVGTLIRGIAAVLAATSVVIYFFASLMLITDRETTAVTIRESIASAFQPPYVPSFMIFSAIRWVVHFLDDSGTYFLVFLLLLVVPVTLAYLIDRFGQRLTRRSLKATLETDDRPYFLYLRGFDEDKLRIDESVGRRGFLELFTPFGRPRFEEVLVEYLSLYGPVIAISGAKQVLSDLGAAKVSLGNDEWRGKVQEWTAGARAVVMSATPREVRAGLEWEIEHVASAAGVRLMLVVSPWNRHEVARRWAGFLERAGATTLFRPLVEQPMPAGVQVMTYSAANGWRGYGARRRWDWTYAASIITAMKRGDLDVPDPAASGTVED